MNRKKSGIGQSAVIPVNKEHIWEGKDWEWVAQPAPMLWQTYQLAFEDVEVHNWCCFWVRLNAKSVIFMKNRFDS